MVRDIKQFWREIRALEAELPDFVWLTAEVRNKGDRPMVMEVTRAVAAKLLQQKTHRHATDAEVAEYRRREKALTHAARIEQMRREGRALVPLSEEEAA